MDSRLIVLALGAFAGTMESVVVPALLPAIGAEMGVTISQAGYLVFAYSLAYAIAAPILASFLGSADRRHVLVAAELVFGCCALAIALAPDFLLMIAGRAVLACAAVLFTSMAQATAMAIAPPERRGRAVAVVMTGATLAIAVGGPVGALIAGQFGWRLTFSCVALLAMTAAAVMWLRLPRGITGERRTLRERLAVVAYPGMPAALTLGGLMALGVFPVGTYFAAITTDTLGLGAEIMPLVLLANGLGSIAGSIGGGHITDWLGPFRTLVALAAATILTLGAMAALPLLPQIAIGPIWLLLFGLAGLLGWATYASMLGILAGLVPKAVPLAVSLGLSAANLGGAIAAVAGELVLDHFGAGAIAFASMLFSSVGLAVAIANRRSLDVPR